MWQCSVCSEAVAEEFDACWSCGASKEGIRDPDFQRVEDVAPDPNDSPRQGPWQFKLWTFFLLVTLLCMPLAYYSFVKRPVAEAEKVADDIEATGGTVLRNGRYLVSVTMGGDPITNETVRLLQERTDLQVLRLMQSKVTDDGLFYLSECSALESLTLDRNAGVTDDGLRHLHSLGGLRRLSLAGTSVTEAGVAELAKHLPDCEIAR